MSVINGDRHVSVPISTMNKITNKTQLSENVFQFTIEAPLISSSRKPGQFILLQVYEDGERIPLTISDANKDLGTITVIVQAVGKTTLLLSKLEAQDSVSYVVGPLGRPTEIDNYGNVVCVAGGIGAAPMYPIAKALKECGNNITTILGAKTKEFLILEDKLNTVSNSIITCTDDGSYGQKALVTEPLEDVCQALKPDLVIAIGPAIMMKAVSDMTRKFNIKTIVSLNTIMVDGTGMCGGCRVSVAGENKFVCVDGPEFDGHKVDFDNMIKRLSSYKKQEKDKYHKCKINNGQ